MMSDMRTRWEQPDKRHIYMVWLEWRESVGDPGEEGQEGPRVKVLTAKKMLVVDCRSYTAAIANRTKGGGCESPGTHRES